MVCALGRAHNRLTPSNGDDLLFDHVYGQKEPNGTALIL